MSVRSGLADPVLDAQRIFRGVLDAMAHPGRIVFLPPPPEPPAPLVPATAAIALTLLDYETPIWLDHRARTEEVIAYLRFHCGAPLAELPRSRGLRAGRRMRPTCPRWTTSTSGATSTPTGRPR